MTAEVKRKNPDALKKAYDRIGQYGKKEVAVGFPAGHSQAYPDGTGVASVAAAHVYGIGVPQRDFMALASRDVRGKSRAFMKAAASAKTEKAADSLLEAAGHAATSAIKAAIVALDTPPNAPSTIAIKGSDNPLIDTGHMLQSVTHIVRVRGKE